MTNLPLIREIHQSELRFLEDMLYEAIFIPEGANKLPRDIINQPELSKYIKDFGRDGDFCLVAALPEKLVGAIWIRLFSELEKGYGYVDSNTPEVSIALYKEYRRKGIGSLLLKEMLQKLTESGYQQVSLSVDKRNYAYALYKKHGFEEYESTYDSETMVKKLGS